NHLEPVSFNYYPLLKRIKDKLNKLGFKKILLSGSGPAMFGFVSSRKEGEKLCEQLKNQRDFKVLLVRTI
ncbi:MAG: 4-(cytidine 5'-diphospho)-2-C-methyl-D-erythritol kinase, partial [Candidatus Omnitrophica bacterium]|nr:4-(cytidine 5'-diphospho)-2-C-methyl-D-erythritol kinase [Candidatus Omnitrophota bacterium]